MGVSRERLEASCGCFVSNLGVSWSLGKVLGRPGGARALGAARVNATRFKGEMEEGKLRALLDAESEEDRMRAKLQRKESLLAGDEEWSNARGIKDRPGREVSMRPPAARPPGPVLGPGPTEVRV